MGGRVGEKSRDEWSRRRGVDSVHVKSTDQEESPAQPQEISVAGVVQLKLAHDEAGFLASAETPAAHCRISSQTAGERCRSSSQTNRQAGLFNNTFSPRQALTSWLIAVNQLQPICLRQQAEKQACKVSPARQMTQVQSAKEMARGSRCSAKAEGCQTQKLATPGNCIVARQRQSLVAPVLLTPVLLEPSRYRTPPQACTLAQHACMGWRSA